MEFIAFLDEHDGFFMALLTFVYIALIIYIFIANNKSVKEIKLKREEKSRQYIIPHICSKAKESEELIIENIGETCY